MVNSGELVAAWIWSVILVFATIAVHVSGLALLALAIPRFWKQDVSGSKSFLDTVPGAVMVITATAFVLASLHVMEAMIWAIVYLRLGALTSLPDASLYSLASMSTIGSVLKVEMQWRVIGAIEGFNGMLLFGISTAFLFSVMKVLWRSVAIRSGAEH